MRVAVACGFSFLLLGGAAALQGAGPVAHDETGPRSSEQPGSSDRSASAGGLISVQQLVDAFRGRLSITVPVVVAFVPSNNLIVSVGHLDGQGGAFSLSIENGFVDRLSSEELDAMIAHELGHVWIYTHHPYLQTEELANEIALRVVSRSALEQLYKKVWLQTGGKGSLTYLPGE